MEGQVYARQGRRQLQVKAADYAFFDVELVPNSGSFQVVREAPTDASFVPFNTTTLRH
jgi:hypothetical protein